MHFIYACQRFTNLSNQSRFNEVKRLNLCTNCLRSGHSNSECKSIHSCKTCNKRHHSLLHIQNNILNKDHNQSHFKFQPELNASPETSSSFTDKSETVCTHTLMSSSNQTFILLSTAEIKVLDVHNNIIKCRALLDSGSQSNFISSNLFHKLKLKGTDVNIPISGISQSSIRISKRVNVKFTSVDSRFLRQLSFLVTNQITGVTPQQYIDTSPIVIPDHITLADNEYNVPAPIDMLLGAEIFWELLNPGQIKLGKNLPCLQETKLGWILSGPICNQNNLDKYSACFLSINTLKDQLHKFWQVEEVLNDSDNLTKDERDCEIHFTNNYKRDKTGRFSVSLPLRSNFKDLGESQEMALKQFYNLEHRLQRNPILRSQYVSFMQEYRDLGHMTEIDPSCPSTVPIYYLPHHGVQKQDSATTKLRVVFNASAKTNTALSLNDVLKVGPTIQNDLFTILLRFRQHNVVMIGDIAKMYRQINVLESERDLQRIIWRDSPECKIGHYQLNTVTYGTASASFLSTRCLKQLAIDFKDQYPLESNIIINDFYVDDLITGAKSVSDLITIRKNIMHVLSSGCFELRQIKSNNSSLIEELTSQNFMSKHLVSQNQSAKTLGIMWNSELDNFEYNSKLTLINPKEVTKRTILSSVSQIFDPLGLLGPVIIQAKILLQKLWLSQQSWDEPISVILYKQWMNFYNQILNSQTLKIRRHALLPNAICVQMHGFCDSSVQAYGACIYLRSENAMGEILTTLVCAKSRVAPLKAISLPRLELLGAVLLTKLMKKVSSSLDIEIAAKYYWTDSTIVLAWIAAEPRCWKTFVCNRTSEIQSLSNTNDWNHISSANNPADLISRGVSLGDLQVSKLWWEGPTFLKKSDNEWSKTSHISNFSKSHSDIPEFNSKSTVLVVTNTLILFENYSSFLRLINVVAYCLRFVKNSLSAPEHRINNIMITPLERAYSERVLIKLVQLESFPDDIQSLKSKNAVRSKSKLSSLNPFIDKDGILRVGGRLLNANIAFGTKHPIVLPKKHKYTILLIEFEHKRNFHAGCQATLSFVRQKYWPLNGREAVRSVIRKCVTCFKVNPPIISNQMGNLPEVRVTPSRVFLNSGVDYAGPFLLKDGKYANRKILKCYICIFICLSTKAVHIELVSELTSNCFISAFKRFISRRGLCKNMYSDNGTGFVGANKELIKVYHILADQPFQQYVNLNQIQWHFIPPRSPHFGGIWEAAVKSVKYHLKRIISDTPFTFEEFYTILTQVESVLNSRPIIPITTDPNDLSAITPGHFIIGEPLNAVPELDVKHVKRSHLSRFQHIQHLVQHFWSRWTKDYLHNLHQRSKWRFKKEPTNLIGQLVVLREDNLPPLKWALGRIVQTHPGKDGVIRVVSVSTKGGVVKRSILKVSVLPNQLH